jgi:hypothetical protein
MALDASTRIGLGGTALFTLAGLGMPILGWEISGPIMVVCALVAGWGCWPLLRERTASVATYWKGSGRRHAALVAVLLVGVAIDGFIRTNSFAIWSRSFGTGEIAWNFEDTARGKGYFLDMQKPLGSELMVAGFGAHGKNTSSEPITDFDGYLRSDKNNETLPVYILAADPIVTSACTFLKPSLPKDTLGIPAFADFNISTSKKPIILNQYEGMPLSRFLNEFVPFTIVLKYNGKSYQRHFTKEEVDRQVAILEKLAGPPPDPYVIRKSTAPAVTVPPPPLATLIPPDVTRAPDFTGTVPEK